MGIRFRKAMKGEDVESQNIDELSDTYLDDELSDTYQENVMSKNIDDPNENEMEDIELYGSLDDITGQMFENEEVPEYSLSETYVNEEEGINFMYPNEWELVDPDEMSNFYAASDLENVIVLLASTSEDADELNTCFMVLKLHENEITMDELLIDDEEFKEMFAATVNEELSNVETSVIELDGLPARVVSCDTESIAFRIYYYGVNSNLYQISFARKKMTNTWNQTWMLLWIHIQLLLLNMNPMLRPLVTYWKTVIHNILQGMI